MLEPLAKADITTRVTLRDFKVLRNVERHRKTAASSVSLDTRTAPFCHGQGSGTTAEPSPEPLAARGPLRPASSRPRRLFIPCPVPQIFNEL